MVRLWEPTRPRAAVFHFVLCLAQALTSECTSPADLTRRGGSRRSKMMRSELGQEGRLEALDQQAAGRSRIDYSVVRNGSTAKGLFIGNKYIEIGVRNNSAIGSLGTDDKPSNFHGGTVKPGIGFVSNPLGFAAGPDSRTNEYIGQHESFSIGYSTNHTAGINRTGHNCASITKTERDGTDRAEIFIEGAVGDLQVWQEINLGIDDKFARVDVRLHNMHRENPIYNVRYMRTVNPENTVDHGGSKSTHQTHELCNACPPRAELVSAISHVHDAYYNASSNRTAKFLYYTEDPRGRVSHGLSGNTPQHGVFDAGTWENRPAKGAKFTGDCWMAINFDVDTIDPGYYADLTFFIGVGDDNMTTMEHMLQQAATKNYGRCSMITCQSGTVMRPEAPVICRGSPCTQDECCVPKAACSTFIGCHKFGSYIPKDPNTSHFCADFVCDDTEPSTGEENEDQDLCCDLECDSYTQEDCPRDRPTNPCMLQDDDCVLACRHYKTEEECPVNGSKEGEDGSESVWCLWEEDKCQAKGTCSEDHFCDSPLVLKMSFPTTCAGIYCNSTDCCGHPGICRDDDCEGPELVLKAQSLLPDKCKRVTCDEAECCDKNKSHPTPAPSSSTVLESEVLDGHAVLLDSDFDELDTETIREKHLYQVEGIENTPAGSREPFAHGGNLRHENDAIAQAKAEWAKMLEEDSKAQLLEEDAAFNRSASDEDEAIDYSVTRTASSWWGKYIGGKYIELGFRTYWGVGKMGSWGVPSGFCGRSNGWGIGMTVNARGFGGGGGDGSTEYCTAASFNPSKQCTGRKLWSWHISLSRCMGFCKSWWWWGCKCITWRPNSWRKCVMMTGNGYKSSSSSDSAMTTQEWSSKCVQAQTIDYFMPGSPEEGFYAGYKLAGRRRKRKAKNFGTSVTISKDDDFAYATIEGTVGKLKVTQTITLGLNDKWFRNDISLQNTGGSTMETVRFMRSFDPDNTVDQGGWYSTEQAVLNCGGPPEPGEDLTPCPNGGVAVSATSRNDAYARAVGATAKVMMYADHESAWAAFGNWGLAPRSCYDRRVWAPRDKAANTDSARTSGYRGVAAPGEKLTRDAWIAMSFNIDNLAAGHSVDVQYWVGLDLLSIPRIGEEIYEASDGPANQFPSCEDHTCIYGTTMKVDAPTACPDSEGYDECRNDECCDQLQHCDEFVCSDFGDYKPAVMENAYCNNTVCDDTMPNEVGRLNQDLETCCELGCSQFGADNCPTTREPHTCAIFNDECVDGCNTYTTVADCEAHQRCATVDAVQDGQDVCADRGDCARDSHVCTAPMVNKATFPDWCAGVDCTDDDCCGIPGVCNDGDCAEDYRLKLHPPPCEHDVCTNDECCFGWPAAIAAHFGTNTGLATIYDFMINCTILFPYVEMPGGDSALNLHVPASGDQVVDLQDNTVCRISDLDVVSECTWQYDYNRNALVARDRKLCSGSADWDCCLKWDEADGTLSAEKCSTCIDESSLMENPTGATCKWCNMIIDDISRNMVMMPMTEGTCSKTEEFCSTVGNECRCLAAEDNSNRVSLATLNEADLQNGHDSTSAKDCRVRFAGIPTATADITTGYGSGNADHVVSFSGSFTDPDAFIMEHEILNTTGETTLSAICMAAAMNNLIVAPGTAYIWPSSFLILQHARAVNRAQHQRQNHTSSKQDPDAALVFSTSDGMAMMEQLLELNNGGPVVAHTLKLGVAAKILAPGANFHPPR